MAKFDSSFKIKNSSIIYYINLCKIKDERKTLFIYVAIDRVNDQRFPTIYNNNICNEYPMTDHIIKNTREE